MYSLNVITLGQAQTDILKQMKIITDSSHASNTAFKKYYLGLCQGDHINRLITLSMITLSRSYSIYHLINKYKLLYKIKLKKRI